MDISLSETIAVTSRAFSKSPVLKEELLQKYSNVRFNETGKTLRGDELSRFMHGCSKAIVSLEAIDDTLLKEVPTLRVISKYGVGLDNLDFSALERHGVLLGWEGGINKRAVSELALALMLSCLRKIVPLNQSLRRGEWQPSPGLQLSSQTVGIIGCGHIGKDLVTLLKPFGTRILAHDIRDYTGFYITHGVEAVSLNELLRSADIVTLHVPYDASTHRILHAERLRQMKKNAILINTARGNLVDETALKERLKTGELAAAAMDVYQFEPPEDKELLELPNFLGTPHIGGSTEESVLAMGRAAIAGLERARPAKTYSI